MPQEAANREIRLNHYKLENIKKLFWPALFIYLGIAFVDAGLTTKYDALHFLAIRVFFFCPYIVIYALRKKISHEKVELYGLTIFSSVAIGLCFVSYLLGGITSDYYLGLLIISFTQFVAMPFKTKNTILFETLIITVYFTLNTLPFESQPVLLSKQLSNYVSYALIKVFVSGRFYKIVADSNRANELQKTLEQRENIQLILGEMCHLLNNPLFISLATLKKAKLEANEGNSERLDKAIEANNRMQVILEEILKVQSSKDLELEDPATLKSILKEENLRTASSNELSLFKNT